MFLEMHIICLLIPCQAEDEDTFDALSKKLQHNQQRNREQLLEDLKQQQYSNDALVNELQQKRDTERGKLIKDIASGEWNALSNVRQC